MSELTDESLPVDLAPFWFHQTVLDGQPIAVLARAFVRHHLAAHRMFHLMDLVSLVAVRLSGSAALEHRGQIRTLSLSQTDAVVLLRVDDSERAARAEKASMAPVDECVGTGVFGLLTLQWGVSRIGDEAQGWWATFDAHRHKQHAVATLEDSVPFTADRLPGHNGGGPWVKDWASPAAQLESLVGRSTREIAPR